MVLGFFIPVCFCPNSVRPSVRLFAHTVGYSENKNYIYGRRGNYTFLFFSMQTIATPLQTEEAISKTKQHVVCFVGGF